MGINELSIDQKILLTVYQSRYPVKSGYIYEKLKGQDITPEQFEKVLNKLFDLGMLETIWEHKDGHSIRLIQVVPDIIPIAKGIEKALKVRHPKLIDPEILTVGNKYSYDERREYMGHMQIEGTWEFKNIYLDSTFWADTMQYVVHIAIPQYCTEADNVVKEIQAIMPHIKPTDGKKRIIVSYDEMYDAPQITFDERELEYGFASESYCTRKEEESKLHNINEIVEYIGKYYPEGVDRTSMEPFTFTARISYESFKGMNIFELKNERGENVMEELSNRFGDDKIEVSVRRL